MLEDRWKDMEVKEGEKGKGGHWEAIPSRAVNQDQSRGIFEDFLE